MKQVLLGVNRFHGANGGCHFVWPRRGTIEIKLRSSDKQFPLVLFNHIMWIESQHNHVAELWVGKYTANPGKEAQKWLCSST